MATIKLHEITARKTPAGHHPITMAAQVVALLPLGGRRVRLANGHELDVLRASGRSQEVSLIGDVVDSLRQTPSEQLTRTQHYIHDVADQADLL